MLVLIIIIAASNNTKFFYILTSNHTPNIRSKKFSRRQSYSKASAQTNSLCPHLQRLFATKISASFGTKTSGSSNRTQISAEIARSQEEEIVLRHELRRLRVITPLSLQNPSWSVKRAWFDLWRSIDLTFSPLCAVIGATSTVRSAIAGARPSSASAGVNHH